MSINIEIVSARSSVWVGIQYSFLSVFLISVISLLLIAVGPVTNPNIFEFLFRDWQMFSIITIAVLLGTLLATKLLRRKISQAYNPKTAFLVNTACFSTLVFIFIVPSAFWGSPYYYGVNSAVGFFERTIVIFGHIIEYAFLNWFIFRKYF